MSLVDQLRDARPPDADGAERRAWAAVAGAAPPRRPRRRRWPMLAMAGLLAALLVAATLGRPGEAVGDWVRRAIDAPPQPQPRATVPARFPGGGMVLATGGTRAGIVRADGPIRRLRAFTGVAWSPRSRFVLGWRGRTLIAVDSRVRTRWRTTAPGTVRSAAWSPDGFRVAYYASGAGVRVVAGDGTGDHVYGRRASEPVLAWRPGSPHTLAVVDRHGRVDVRDVDTARLVTRTETPVGRHASHLAWSADGRRLAVAGGGRLTLLDVGRGRVQRVALPVGWRAIDAAWSPSRRALAVLLRSRRPAGSRVAILDGARIRRSGTHALAAQDRLAWPVALDRIAWSPDERWLLAGWPATRQWLFVRAAGAIGVRLRPAPRMLGARPSIAGWRR